MCTLELGCCCRCQMCGCVRFGACGHARFGAWGCRCRVPLPDVWPCALLWCWEVCGRMRFGAWVVVLLQGAGAGCVATLAVCARRHWRAPTQLFWLSGAYAGIIDYMSCLRTGFVKLCMAQLWARAPPALRVPDSVGVTSHPLDASGCTLNRREPNKSTTCINVT